MPRHQTLAIVCWEPLDWGAQRGLVTLRLIAPPASLRLRLPVFTGAGGGLDFAMPAVPAAHGYGRYTSMYFSVAEDRARFFAELRGALLTKHPGAAGGEGGAA